MAKAKTVNEDTATTMNFENRFDATGGGVELPKPITQGNAPNLETILSDPNTSEAPIAHIPGEGDVPQSAVLKALIVKLGNLPPDVLAAIANELEANTDIEANPTGEVHGNVDQNFASILSTNEDVEELFAGQDLSEEFKAKAKVIFEAAVGARVAILKLEINEAKESEIAEAIEQVTEEIVDKIDKYLTFAAEEYVSENKVEIEQTIETTVAEEFMKEVYAVASRFNINVPSQDLNVVEDLTSQVDTLTADHNKTLEALVEAKAQLKVFESDKALAESTKDLTATQRERVKTLAENVEYESNEQFRGKLAILVESVTTATAKEAPAANLIVENKEPDGVAILNENESHVSEDPIVAATRKALDRIRK